MSQFRMAASVLALVFAASSLSSTATAQQCVDFAFTGAQQDFVVPSGVSVVSISAFGAQGASAASGGIGGRGAWVFGDLPVTPGETLAIFVGGQNGFNGGGAGGTNGNNESGPFPQGFAGNGGGATDVRSGALGLNDRVLVAGGGGGGGHIGVWQGCQPASPAGDGGALAGGDGSSVACNCGGGGGAGGQPGTLALGGLAGAYAGSTNCLRATWFIGEDGTFGQGGSGNLVAFNNGTGGGGGGGGGYYGGGSGGNGSDTTPGGGGGGGSSYIGGVNGGSVALDVVQGDGSAQLCFIAKDIVVTPISGLTTTEAGGTAVFTVILSSPPTADVSVALSSSDISEGTVAPSSLVFSAANWDVPQAVTVTGVDDALTDGDIGYTIVTAAATSADADYNGIDAADVTATNIDDDVAAIMVTPTNGLSTTEAGGTAGFTVVLTSEPTADVTIALSSSDVTEGTVAPPSLVFSAANWNVAQPVTVTGADDALADGDIGYTIVTAAAMSADASYAGMDASDVSATNIDDDAATIMVTPTSGLTTTETSGTAGFTVVLSSEPTADVTIALSSSDVTEGAVAPASLVFSAANWNVAQPVTVTGADDALADGDIGYTIVTAAAMSADASYAGMDASDVSATNIDDDAATIMVTPTSGLTTTETSGTAGFTVVLSSQPTTDVTIALSSSDVSEGTVAPASLVFSAANWNVAQPVTVTGVDDALADGDIAYTIVTAAAVSADASYAGMNASDVSATNIDDDVAAIMVTPTSGLSTTEAGGTASITVVLASQPTADVTIAPSSSDPSEASIAPASLVFTAGNWNVAQTITVTGMPDSAPDGDQPFAVTFVVSSADPAYAGLAIAAVSGTNLGVGTGAVVTDPLQIPIATPFGLGLLVLLLGVFGVRSRWEQR